MAVGNILGGIVIQSLLLVLFDFASRKEKKPLSTLVSDKASIVQGLFLIIILVLLILGKQLKESNILFRSTAPEVLIAFSWIVSILLLRRVQNKKDDPQNLSQASKLKKYSKKSTVLWLIFISVFVLVFGVLLEITSDTIATHYSINGVVFGANILAVISSLPKNSGGLATVKEKTYQPIISDIFAGMHFYPCCF